MNFAEKILIFLALLKYVENQTCPDWIDWKNFKTNFSITYFNLTLDVIGLVIYYFYQLI